MTTKISKRLLFNAFPNGNKKILESISEYVEKHRDTYGLSTNLRMAHFLSQCAHESANFRTLQEYASGAAYEGRRDLGNTHSGDGRRFKGRGMIQLTGRSNYKYMSKKLGVDLISNPKKAMSPEISVLTAMEYWRSRKLNSYADRDNIRKITKLINGGYNGYKDRVHHLKRAKKYLGVSARKPAKTLLPALVEVQKLLVAKGYKIMVDGVVGPKTKAAIMHFQRTAGLTVDGIAGPNTLSALKGK